MHFLQEKSHYFFNAQFKILGLKPPSPSDATPVVMAYNTVRVL